MRPSQTVNPDVAIPIAFTQRNTAAVPMAILEIACFSADDAIAAWRAGADRIELCAEHALGGTTPSHETLQRVRNALVADSTSSDRPVVPVHVMIRPRGGDFVYTAAEQAQMRADIARFHADADGFVLGLLTRDGAVDVAATADLVHAARPRPCTFHRAFDAAAGDLPAALEAVVDTGCRAVLTSGGAPDALAGVEMLARLVRAAAGRLDVIPGGGVRAANLHVLRARTAAPVFHSSGLVEGGSAPAADEIRGMAALLRDHDGDDGTGKA